MHTCHASACHVSHTWMVLINNAIYARNYFIKYLSIHAWMLPSYTCTNKKFCQSKFDRPGLCPKSRHRPSCPRSACTTRARCRISAPVEAVAGSKPPSNKLRAPSMPLASGASLPERTATTSRQKPRLLSGALCLGIDISGCSGSRLPSGITETPLAQLAGIRAPTSRPIIGYRTTAKHHPPASATLCRACADTFRCMCYTARRVLA